MAARALRRRAVEKAKNWMIERLHHSDGLGAIYPPMMYSVMALDVLGYAKDDPLRVEALRHFNNLMVDDGDRFFFQPCFSPVWDTAIGAYALGQADPAHESIAPAADWLLSKEVRRKGDWSVKRPNTEPSGWAFEYSNEYYPDIDDTAMVMLALGDMRASDPEAQAAACKRGLAWLLAMQSSDGGWAAFDADNNWEFLSQVPFADHNAMLDPTCADITGRVLEALAAHGLDRNHKAVRRGAEWLIKHQESDGSWYGRWGVAYIYGTCFALRGLAASGESDREAHILRAGEWLRSIQNADGGWGESCKSYDNRIFTGGPSTPSQTAWAILGLIAGGDPNSLSVQHGIEYLLETQRSDGSWDEQLATGTGFPRVFYLNYHLYKDYFPLLALSSFVKAAPPRTGSVWPWIQDARLSTVCAARSLSMEKPAAARMLSRATPYGGRVLGWHVARVSAGARLRCGRWCGRGAGWTGSTWSASPAICAIRRRWSARSRAADWCSTWRPTTGCGRRIRRSCTAPTWMARAICWRRRARRAWSARSIPARWAASACRTDGIGDEAQPVKLAAHGRRLQALQVPGREGGAGIRARRACRW